MTIHQSVRLTWIPQGQQMIMKQFIITSSMGKRLIALGMVRHAKIQSVLKAGTLVIIAGSTNGYVAEEILKATGQAEGFSRKGFRRGTVVPPGSSGPPKAALPGDVVITDGVWRESDRGKTIFDVVDDLSAGDVVLKGANAVDVHGGQAAVYIGHPQAGTIGATLPIVAGRRVQLIVPVGLEKRVLDDVNDLAAEVNATETEGPRLLPMPGEVFTELDAIAALTGGSARLIAAGGIYGAEGCVWIGVKGTDEQLDAAEKTIQAIAGESPCEV